MRKILASIISEKDTAIIKRIRECRTHFPMCKSKEKKSGKFVEIS